MRVSATLPRGVAGLLFDSARRRRTLESRLVAGLEDAGFTEVILPIIDYLEPYEPLLGTVSREELYRFFDREGEQLVLRADFTPMLARLLAPRLSSLALPLRLFYRGDVVRFQEPRAGRMRELYQIGAELVGEAGENAEHEMLRLFLRLLDGGGRGPVRIVLGFAGALDRLLPADERAVGRLGSAIDRRNRGETREASPALLEVVEDGVPRDPACLGASGADRLARVEALADELREEFPSAAVAVDLAEFARHGKRQDLARGTGRFYYDGLIFRAYVGSLALPVGQGGRYDRLFRRLGAEAPAVGFSIGIDRLAEEPS